MGCALSMCASCACSGIASLCCSLGCSSKGTVRGAKPVYLGFLALSTMLALIFRFWGTDNINLVAWRINCMPPNLNGTGISDTHWDPAELITGPQKQYYASCKGNAAVYRISFMTAAFFLLMAAFSAVSKAAHVGMWMIKFLLYCILIVS